MVGWIFSLYPCHAIPEYIARAVYSTLPADVANELAYVPDQMILDFLFTKVKFGVVMDKRGGSRLLVIAPRRLQIA